MIEYQLPPEISNTANVFHTSLPFHAIQIINPFFSSSISATYQKKEAHSAYGEILIIEI